MTRSGNLALMGRGLFILWLIIIDRSVGGSAFLVSSTGVCKDVIIRRLVDFKSLESCNRIEGHLQIRNLLNRSANLDGMIFKNLTEITDYILINNFQSDFSLAKMFPNLSLIRGEHTLNGYSIVIYDVPKGRNLWFPSLKTILRGQVRIQSINCESLRFSATPWYDLISSRNSDVIDDPTAKQKCFICDLQSPKKAPACPEKCANGCSEKGECCSDQCLNGCHKPNNPKQCLQCKNYLEDSTCVEICSKKTLPFGHSCITERECSFNLNKSREECLASRGCPQGYVHVPKPNLPVCVPESEGCVISDIHNADDASHLFNCHHLYSNLVIRSITGGDHNFFSRDLKYSLGNIKTIDGYLQVDRTVFLDLSFIPKNLNITGSNNFTLMITNNDKLESLDALRGINIGNGRINISNNAKLCQEDVDHFLLQIQKETTEYRDENFVSFRNGYKQFCIGNNSNSPQVSVEPILDKPESLLVTWSPHPEIKTTSYLITYYSSIDLPTHEFCSDSNSYKVEIEDARTLTSTQQSKYELKNLKPETEYSVYIQNIGSNIKWDSNILKATTSGSQDVRVLAFSNEPLTLDIKWDSPAVQNETYFVVVAEPQKHQILQHLEPWDKKAVKPNKVEKDNQIGQLSSYTSASDLTCKTFDPCECSLKEKEKNIPATSFSLKRSFTNELKSKNYQDIILPQELSRFTYSRKTSKSYLALQLNSSRVHGIYVYACTNDTHLSSALCHLLGSTSAKVKAIEDTKLASKVEFNVTNLENFKIAVDINLPQNHNFLYTSVEVESLLKTFYLINGNHIRIPLDGQSLPSGNLSGFITLYNNANNNGTILPPFLFWNEHASDHHSLVNIAIAIVILLVITMVILLWLYYKKRPAAIEVEKIDVMKLNFVEKGCKILDPNLQEVTNEIGKGNFGIVYEGKYDNEPVAIKTLIRNTDSNREQFIREITKSLDLKCYHIVEGIGVTIDKDKISYVMELMCYKLQDYLRDIRNEVTSQRIISWAIQAADGMAYLESKNLIHRDLAARNCSLDSKLILKICDFGLSAKTNPSNDGSYTCTKPIEEIPYKWMAPETLENDPVFTSKSDVYSYGVLLWEILSKGETPYKNLPMKKVIKEKKMGNYLKIEEKWKVPDPLSDILPTCWNCNPHLRCSFIEICDKLIKFEFANKDVFKQHSFYRKAEKYNSDDNDSGKGQSTRVSESSPGKKVAYSSTGSESGDFRDITSKLSFQVPRPLSPESNESMISPCPSGIETEDSILELLSSLDYSESIKSSQLDHSHYNLPNYPNHIYQNDCITSLETNCPPDATLLKRDDQLCELPGPSSFVSAEVHFDTRYFSNSYYTRRKPTDSTNSQFATKRFSRKDKKHISINSESGSPEEQILLNEQRKSGFMV